MTALDWWSQRSERERALLAALGAAALLFAVVFLVWRPIIGFRANAAAQAEAGENTYRLIARAARLGAKSASPAEAATSVRAALTEAAGGLAVELSFVNARDDGAVDAQIAAAPPEKVFLLLSMLERRYGVKVSAIDVARVTDGATEVRAQMTLAR